MARGTGTFSRTIRTAVIALASSDDAPSDGGTYARQNGAWASFSIPSAGISDAPSNGSKYARKNAAWEAFTVPPDPVVLETRQVVFDHFTGGTAYSNGWSVSASGSLGITVGTDVYPGLMGVLILNTSTGANGRTCLCKNSGASYISFGTVAVDLVMRVVFDSVLFDGTITGQYRLGFIDTVNATDVDGCFFYSINGGNLFAICRSNNVQTATDLGFAPALDGWHSAKVSVNDDGTSCAFYWDGSLVATITTNIPVNRGTGIGLLISKTSTNASNARLAVDWVYEGYEPATPLVF